MLELLQGLPRWVDNAVIACALLGFYYIFRRIGQKDIGPMKTAPEQLNEYKAKRAAEQAAREAAKTAAEAGEDAPDEAPAEDAAPTDAAEDAAPTDAAE